MFPAKGKTAKTDRVYKYTQLPQRPSSRWRYQFEMVADYVRERDGRVEKNVKTYSAKLERTLSRAVRRRMYDEAELAGINFCRFKYDDETDEPWFLIKIRRRAVIVWRQHREKHPETLKPISTYLKPRQNIRQRRRR